MNSCNKQMYMEYGRLMAMSISELEREIKLSSNFERREFICNIINKKKGSLKCHVNN